MSEHEPYLQPDHEVARSPELQPARETDGVDWRRIDVTMGRFGDHLATGITRAMDNHSEIDQGTARVIAHVLGRGLGRQSALAEFGRSGDGDYLALRDEYLDIYTGAEASSSLRELIDWFGTYLVHRDQIGSERRFMNEHLPPKLEQLLVRTDVEIRGEQFTVHLPAAYGSTAIHELAHTLVELRLNEDDALQAFLSLPDVNAMSGDIMGSFHETYIGAFNDHEDTVHGLLEIGEWETEVRTFAAERHLFIDDVTPDYQALFERVCDTYDIVDWKGRVYAFYT